MWSLAKSYSRGDKLAAGTIWPRGQVNSRGKLTKGDKLAMGDKLATGQVSQFGNEGYTLIMQDNLATGNMFALAVFTLGYNTRHYGRAILPSIEAGI